ncbi:MAG: DUF4215 domain-containing protein [Candidatus Binatia bacterium]
MNLSTTLPPTRSRRRHSGLGAIGAGILAVSLMALAGAAAPAAAADCSTNAPLNECIPGGATSRLDCLQEWLSLPDTARNYKGVPKPKIVCYEGDPNCDSDPDLNNGLCTFRTQICINNTDPRLPNCVPSDVTTFEFDQRDRNANDPADTANKDNIEWELGSGGLGPYIVQDQQLVYAGVVNDTPNLCSGEIQLFVPMTQRPDGSYKKARRRFRVRASSSDGRVDVDTFTYWCLPSRCGDGYLEPKKEQCDDGNRDNDDGCDQGCYIVPTPTPTPSPSPSPSPTASPSPSPTPSPTPEPTQTPEPTPTPDFTPTPSPEPTQSPTPTASPSPSPSPIPQPTLGIWSFGVSTGNSALCPGTALSDGTQLRSSGVPGSNSTGGGSVCSLSRGNFAVSGNFTVQGGSINPVDGKAPIELLNARVVRVQQPTAASSDYICLRIEGNGPGFVDCDGGTNTRLLAQMNSNGVNPPSPPSWDPLWLNTVAGDSGAGMAQLPVKVKLIQQPAVCPAEGDVAWSTVDPLDTVITTGQAQAQILSPRSCPNTVVIYNCPSGASFTSTIPSTASLSCAAWTTQTSKTFQTPIFLLDGDFGSGNIGDMAVVARLRSSP